MASRIYSQKYKQISYHPSRLPLTWSFHKKNYHWQTGIQDLRCLNKRVLSQQNLVQKALALLSARMSKVSPKSKAPFYWGGFFAYQTTSSQELGPRSSKIWGDQTDVYVHSKPPATWSVPTLLRHGLEKISWSSQNLRLVATDTCFTSRFACLRNTLIALPRACSRALCDPGTAHTYQ